MTYQTKVQNPNAIRRGSCRFEVEDWPGAFIGMTDVGVLDSPKLTVRRQMNSFTPDNSSEIPGDSQIVGVEIVATLYEWTLATLAKLGLGTVTTEDGTPVSGKTLVVASGAWDYSKFIPVTDQPGVSIASVAGSTNLALVDGTDYHVLTDDEGVTGIIVLDSETVTTKDQTLTITYGYTPVASQTITLGGGGAAPKYIAAQLTNTNAAGKKICFRVFKAQLTSDVEFVFTADSAGEPIGLPVTLKGYVDHSLPVDKNVIQFIDEQAV